jgi:RimJ/RimL family protein N-acetyltransferase
MTPDPHSFSLETDRLILRPLTQTDAAPLTRLLNDFEVSKWLSRIPYPYGVIEMQWFIARLNSPYRFGIVHKGTGRIMGGDRHCRTSWLLAWPTPLAAWLYV